tara:strand:- start:577 stop:1467 length:891 start_codon:yes stop_codon:yes gene_type:complete
MAIGTAATIFLGVMAASTVVSTISGISQSNKANDLAEEGMNMTQDQVNQQLELQAQAQAELDKQREAYRKFEFTNPYENMENVFAGMENVYEGAKNVYEGMENVYEDLQVSTVAADFQMEQAAQQRANILAGLSSAAGSSGIAGLAQTLAQQGTLQSRQVSVDLARQQQANERLRAQGAMQVQMAQLGEESRLQQLTLAEQARIDQLQRQGAGQVQMAQLAGEQFIQEAEMGRQATLLGVAYGGAAGASAATQQAYANQMSMMMAQSTIAQQNATAAYNMAGQSISAAGQVLTPYV